MARLKGRIALITGAGAGIGRESAQRFAREGAALALADLDLAAVEAVAAEIQAEGGTATGILADVSEEASVQAMVAAAEAALGGLDIAFNNAGIEGAGLLPLIEESEDNMRNVMDVNFFGVWNSMKAEVPALVERGGGVIINTTSVAGLKGFGMFSSYVSSKFAVEGLSRSVAQEVAGAGIRVNTIAPGPIDTALLDRATGSDHSMFTQHVPMQRAGTVEEVAGLVRFLASDDAAYVTGHALRVDGGMMS